MEKKTEKKLTPEVKRAIEAMVFLCPFWDHSEFSVEDFTIKPNQDSTGWYFKCGGCKKVRCTGFVKDDK
jgi:hypothetical protein